MRYRQTVATLLFTTLLSGCTASAKHDQHDAGMGTQDAGINWDLSEGNDSSDSGDDRDALASLVTCGEAGDSIHHLDVHRLEGCERSYFTIVIDGYLEPNIPELRSLVRSEGVLHLIREYYLTDLTDLSRLEYADEVLIRFMPDLTNLHGLESLHTVKKTLYLKQLGVTDLTALSSLTSVGGLNFVLPYVTSMDGLQSLERVDGNVSVTLGVSREEFLQFLEGVEVTGTVTFNGEEL